MNRLNDIRILLIAWVLAPQAAHAAPGASVRVARVATAPRLADFVTMEPGEGATALSRVTGFIQELPSDGQPPTERTDVYLAYDSNRLYLVWVCHDGDPRAVRAHGTPRDAIDPAATYNDDYVEVTLDTFHDQRHGFVFSANALGIQTDALWTEDAQLRDVTWDERWESRGQLIPDGYVVSMEIPFKSLRFPPIGEQTWGITLARYNARKNETDYWPRVSSRVSGKLNQEGLLTGMEGVLPSRNLQATPYTYARGFRDINDVNPGAPYYESATQGRVGSDLKWVLNESLVLDATANPDFSQLESDQPQVTVNRRFAVYYPEKRPFFLENSDFFDSAATTLGLSQLVFTRGIADPGLGAKLSGKEGAWDIGLLVASDRSPGESVPPGDPDDQRSARVGLLRATYDLGTQSTIGVLYTDRELNGGFNRVGAIDASLRLSPNWTAYVREAVSSSKCLTSSSLCLTGETAYSEQLPFGAHGGTNAEMSLNGSGRHYFLSAQYQDITAHFHTDLGYVPRTDFRNLFLYYHYYFRPEGARLINWGAETNLQRIWDHQGLGTDYVLNVSPFVGLRGNTKFWFPILTSQSDTIRPQDFAGLTANRKFVQNSVGGDFRTAPVRWAEFDVKVVRQGTINFVAPIGQVPNEADEWTVASTLAFKPTRSLQVRTTYLLDRVVHDPLGHAVFNNHIVRSEITYQHDPRLGFRFIPQYNGLLANPEYSSLTTTRNFNVDLLMTYLLHPGTAAYLGYNSNFENVAPGLCTPLPGSSACDPNGGILHVPGPLRNDGRQIFFKITYQFRA